MGALPGEAKLEDFDPKTQAILEEAMEAIEFLVAEGDRDKAYVQEDVIKRDLLPVFHKRGSRVSMEIWLKLAGSLVRPIVIVNGRGEILFELPPPLHRIDETLNIGKKGGVNGVVQMAKYAERTLPALADKQITSNLTQHVKGNKPTLEDIRAWDKVFVHYGYESILTDSQKDSLSESKDEEQTTKTTMEMTYDNDW